MNWENRFFIQKPITHEVEAVIVGFGLFGLLNHLGLSLDIYETPKISKKLDTGIKTQIGQYTVWKDLHYIAQ